MEDTLETSRLFESIFALEKDYKYNSTLLKIKNEEIERCKLTIKNLQDTIENYLEEIKDLKMSNQKLEQSFVNCKQDSLQEKKICEDLITKLTIKLNEAKTKHRLDLEEGENKIKLRCTELEDLYMKNLNENESLHKKALAGIESDLQKETDVSKKLREKIEALVYENAVLHKDKTEIIKNLNFEVEVCKNEKINLNKFNQELQTEISIIKNKHKESLINFNNVLEERNKNLENIKINNDQWAKQVAQNNYLLLQVENYQVELQNLINEINDFKRKEVQWKELEDEIERLKRSQACFKPSHENVESILKQNFVLQDIVKSIRKEREDKLKEGEILSQETEHRINGLEELLLQLKGTLFQNILHGDE